MAGVGIYLNFPGTCEEAFGFYEGVFGVKQEGLMRLGDTPPMPGAPELTQDQRNLVMHVAMPIIDGTMLMGSDVPPGMGEVVVGTNVTIDLECDSVEDARRLYDGLSAGSTQGRPISEEFWGYWGTCLDRYGIRWMFNAPVPTAP